MTFRTFFRLSAAGTLAALLAGCALLSSPDPVQLYRFGSEVQTPPSSPLAESPVPVLMRPVNFPEASKGDRILGITGYEAAYIKGARWVSPAEDLYGQSLQAAFASQATRLRIIGLREASTAARTLDIDIQAFEARYAAPDAAPEVLLTARARAALSGADGAFGKVLHSAPAGHSEPHRRHRRSVRHRQPGPEHADRRLDGTEPGLGRRPERAAPAAAPVGVSRRPASPCRSPQSSPPPRRGSRRRPVRPAPAPRRPASHRTRTGRL
jgi:cholesterol transport system auxiliary component